jgi:uncharacterized membrane protein HdeD (DUF308 family)
MGSMEISAARRASKASSSLGAGLMLLGVFAVMAPMFTGVAVTALIGMLLFAGGGVEIVFAFRAGSFGKGALRFLFGGLGVLAGVVFLATPMRSLAFLAYVLAFLFVAGGIVDVVLFLRLQSKEGWGRLVFSGIVSILLGVLVILQWPVSGTWAVGLYVGVRMLMHGWVLMAFGTTGQEVLVNLQDSRIEMLENHVRAGARALQETQASLADQTAMLVALDGELRKKVSSSEVDPAILELNRKLAEARVQMDQAATATRDSWNRTQKEANAAFEALRESAAEMSGRLKKELGLDKHDHPAGEQVADDENA